MVRAFSTAERRRLVVQRHHLAGDATGTEAAATALIGLHATDPASVYMAVLARSPVTIGDVASAMYERRSLVRWLAMRRTLFVFPVADVPMVQAAISDPLAISLRTRLVNKLTRNGTDPALSADPATWVDTVVDEVVAAARHRGSVTGAELGIDVPRLRTTIRPHAPSDQPQKVTSSLLAMLSAQGRIVRGTPTGAWTSRQHRWEPVERWWPDGLPVVPSADAERELARRYLKQYGPATADDLQWWTGWSKSTTARALATLSTVDVDLDGRPGLVVVEDAATAGATAEVDGVATLLPSLDATAMGWRHRDWYLNVEPKLIYDRAGNIGPTVWWNGEIVGSWAVAGDGEIRTACVADRGADADRAILAAAEALQGRLDGAVVTPAIRTPLERSLL